MTLILRFLGFLGLVIGSTLFLPAEPPRSIRVWAAGPLETRVAFDQAVDPQAMADLVGKSIRFVEPPSVPDAREGSLKIAAARLVDENRTLILLTDPHPRAARYILDAKPLQLQYDLSGVEVTWASRDEQTTWTSWWPTFDLGTEVHKLAQASVEHGRGLRALETPGVLGLRTLVALPKGKVALKLTASRSFEATFGSESAAAKEVEGSYSAQLTTECDGEPVELTMTLKTDQGSKNLAIQSSVEIEGSAVPLKSSQLSLPWVPTPPSLSSDNDALPKFEGGNSLRGKEVFYGTDAKCATCHKVEGKGGEVGPDLSAVGVHDKAWIYRNIFAPSASIHPDYVSYTLARKSGQVAMGVIKSDGPVNLKVLDTNAAITVVPRNDVEELRPSSSSIMPVGLLGAIGEERTRDLIAYLASLKPKN